MHKPAFLSILSGSLTWCTIFWSNSVARLMYHTGGRIPVCMYVHTLTTMVVGSWNRSGHRSCLVSERSLCLQSEVILRRYCSLTSPNKSQNFLSTSNNWRTLQKWSHYTERRKPTKTDISKLPTSTKFFCVCSSPFFIHLPFFQNPFLSISHHDYKHLLLSVFVVKYTPQLQRQFGSLFLTQVF